MPEGEAPDINNLRRFTTADVRQDFYDAAAGGKFEGQSMEDWVKIRPEVLRLIAGSKPGKHFVKTHCQPRIVMGTHLIPPQVTAGAIYVLRNPFDVAPSFARHTVTDVDRAIANMANPDQVLATKTKICDVIGRWDEHVTAWTTAPGLPRHVVRYEDLLEKPTTTMEALLDFMSIKPDRPKLAKAIKATRFETMKKQEEQEGFIERPANVESFFNKGKAGSWREDLTPAQVGQIRAEFFDTIEKYYPEMLDETAAYAAAS